MRATTQAKAASVKSITEGGDEDIGIVESDASNSADEYAPEEEDEAYSEEDELNDPLSKDLEELEVQLHEEVSEAFPYKWDRILTIAILTGPSMDERKRCCTAASALPQATQAAL